jgi:transposase InsO family protein
MVCRCRRRRRKQGYRARRYTWLARYEAEGLEGLEDRSYRPQSCPHQMPAPMELWQMDVVGGFPLADGSCAKALTGLDDHSRMCVSARLMARERTRAVCDGLRASLAAYGAPSPAPDR